MADTRADLSLASLLAPADEGRVLLDSGGRVVAWNATATAMLGFTANEAVGRSIHDFFVDLPDAAMHLLTADDSSADWFVARGARQTGDAPDVMLTRTALHDAHGHMAGALICVKHSGDVLTEQGVTSCTPEPAEILHDSATAASDESWDSERLRIALAAARLGDWSWDMDTDMVNLSPRAAELFEIPAGPVMTWTALRDLIHPDDREATRNAVEQAVATHGDYAVEYRVINGNHERWIAASGRARYDEHGRVLGMFGVVQDISKDRLLLRVDDAVRPLVKPEDITYTAARVLGQYLRVNRCAYAFVEDDEDSFSLTGNYNDGVQSIVGHYRFRQFGAECLRLMRAGEPYVVEDSETDARIDADDRESYRFTAIRAVICVPIHKAGRFVAAMAVHTAVPRIWSAREVELVQQVASRCWESIERARFEHEREDLLRAAEAANRTKDEFLAMLGHELRNPLSPILTALQVMKLRGGSQNEWERQVIERQVSHLTRLVDDLLDVSRIARGKVELKRAIVEMSEVVGRAIEVASPLLEQRSHALDVDVPRTGLAVDGDVERLTQVVSNLLTNAGKYTSPGGRIAVRVLARHEEVILQVYDNGMGIAPDLLPHVFDLFMQGTQTIERAHGGLGLGLAIVRSLVERHGGSVSAHSEGPGHGSLFEVRLPAAKVRKVPVPVVEKTTAIEAGPGMRDAHILVVDDNEDAADSLATALRIAGSEVHVVRDGPGALSAAATRHFDVALLDIGLPVMDGYELAGRLRDLPDQRDIRLIAVTGYGQEADRKRALAAGFAEHLVKPVDLQLLKSVIVGLLRE